MYLLDNQQQKTSAASAAPRETHNFEHSPLGREMGYKDSSLSTLY
jgi:hypothetical protein